jgi:hypothetical protein
VGVNAMSTNETSGLQVESRSCAMTSKDNALWQLSVLTNQCLKETNDERLISYCQSEGEELRV